MKKLLLTAVVCVVASLTLTLTAQTQQGYVKTIGKPGKKGVALSGVTVRVKGEHNAVVSKADGKFSMTMPGKKNGQPYTLQQVQKAGYELNEKGVVGRQYAFSSTVPLTIVMVSTAQLQADKQRIENNAYKTAEKNYKAKMAKLEKQLQEKSISEEQYRAELQDLQDKFEKYQNLIDELAEHYAHTDYDVLDEKEAEVNILIENGELERADSLIHTLFDPIDVIKRNKEALTRLDQTIAGAQGIIDQANADLAAVLKKQEKDAEYLYQLYTIALAQFDNEKAARYIQTRAELDTTNVVWQYEAGQFLNEYMADYDTALMLLNRGLRQTQSQFNEDSQINAAFYQIIGGIYYEQGGYDEALRHYQRAVGIYIERDDIANPIFASICSDVGLMHQQLGEYDSALEWYGMAMDAFENVFGEEDHRTGTTYHNIASVYSDLGNYSEALEWYNKALAVYEHDLGAEHLETAGCYHNIGSVYDHLGDYEQAMEWYVKALAIREKLLGQKHPLTALSYNNIGVTYIHMDDYALAMDYCQKALAIREQILGVDHPLTAATYHNIGSVYEKQEEYEQAMAYYNKALDIKVREMGDNNVEVSTEYNSIGVIYYYLENYDEALGYFLKSMEISERVLGEMAPMVALTCRNIGAVYENIGLYSEAIKFYQRAITIDEHVYGSDYPEIEQLKADIDVLNALMGE